MVSELGSGVDGEGQTESEGGTTREDRRRRPDSGQARSPTPNPDLGVSNSRDLLES